MYSFEQYMLFTTYIQFCIQYVFDKYLLKVNSTGLSSRLVLDLPIFYMQENCTVKLITKTHNVTNIHRIL